MSAAPATLSAMTIADKLVRLLDERGVTQSELSARIGVIPNRVSKWCRGEGEPKPAHVLAIARTLGVSTDYLCDDTLTEPGQQAARSAGPYADLIAMIEVIGAEEARRRLLQAPESRPPAPPAPAPSRGRGKA